jgi:hypothetical protein
MAITYKNALLLYYTHLLPLHYVILCSGLEREARRRGGLPLPSRGVGIKFRSRVVSFTGMEVGVYLYNEEKRQEARTPTVHGRVCTRRC